jgi:hypothetical protein
MHYKHLLPILFTILVVSAGTVGATDLRGRVDGLSGPLPLVDVALFAGQNGTFTLVHKTVTDRDGMYYFTGVRPGQYVLQLAGVNYPLDVGTGPTQDIPIIRR